MLDFGDPRFWLDAAQTLAVAALWLRRPGEDALKTVARLEQETQQRLAEVTAQTSKSLADIKGLVDVHAERLSHIPTDEELAKLEGTVRAMSERVDGMRDELKEVRQGVSSIRTFLLEHR